MKISPDEPIITLMGKLLLYAIKETMVASLIFLIGGILLDNLFMSVVPVILIITWVQGYVKGRADE